MTDIEQRREWLALLEEALARRAARVELQAGEAERQREAARSRTLEQMAQPDDGAPRIGIRSISPT